ncbi:MAG: formate--tetrahydrofolate ligase, partial [Betaproteobacteria bacterium]|nr:formate--tetrahydrofolate ligase [Betaproteobacteria bacterium]
AVLVATIRAVKYHGGVARDALSRENTEAVRGGFDNVRRHLRNTREHYGVPAVIALNHFAHDTDAEIAEFRALCEDAGAEMSVCRHWAEGGKGATELAEKITATATGGMKFLYEDSLPLAQKMEAVAQKIYGAGSVRFAPKVAADLALWQENYGHFPVCVAKTQYAFTNEPTDRGIPRDGYDFFVSGARLNTGAEFVVLLGGDIMTMPGLPKTPAAAAIDVDDDGNISGLF